MSRTDHEIAKAAVVIALLVAASPMREHSPNPIAGVRTALELIAKKRSSIPRNEDRGISSGTA